MSSWNRTLWKFWVEAYVEYYNAYEEYLYNMNSSENSTSFNSSGIALNFSQIWLDVYDLTSIPLNLVLIELNATTGLESVVESWFNSFFGMEGYVYLNTTESMLESSLTVSIEL